MPSMGTLLDEMSASREEHIRQRFAWIQQGFAWEKDSRVIATIAGHTGIRRNTVGKNQRLGKKGRATSGERGQEKGDVNEVSEDGEGYDSRDIGGIWEVPRGRKAGRHHHICTTPKLPPFPSSGSRSEERWTPIYDGEESDVGGKSSINLVNSRRQQLGSIAHHG